MNQPEHIILQLVQEAWPNNIVKVFSIEKWRNNTDYWTVKYGVKLKDIRVDQDGYNENYVSYSYPLHIQPKIEQWRNDRLKELLLNKKYN